MMIRHSRNWMVVVFVVVITAPMLFHHHTEAAFITSPATDQTQSNGGGGGGGGESQKRESTLPDTNRGVSVTHTVPPMILTIMQTRWRHLLLATVLGFALDPLVEAVFNVTYLVYEGNDEDMHTTFLYGAADSLSNGAKTAALVYAIDILQHIFQIRLPFPVDLAEVAPRIGWTVWFTMTLSTVKRTIFRQKVSSAYKQRLGRVALYDRLIDFILGIGAVANVLNILAVDVGVGLQSLFAASGVSALVFTVASKGLVEQIVAGFIIQAWDAIEEGEKIRLGDGTEGVVKRIGLVETEVVGFDSISTRIPNSQLTGQRVSPLSKLTVSQVKQVLRFKYSDLDKIPTALDDMKNQIRTNCPKLITDGSKGVDALITSYEPDHVQGLVVCNFAVNPKELEYMEIRQAVLLSIAHAMKKNDMEFAIPSISFQTTNGGSGPVDTAVVA